MADNVAALPPGFELETPAAAPATQGLPKGFQLEAPAPVSATGTMLSAAQGIRQGVEGAAGLPGDANSIMGALMPSENRVRGWLGMRQLSPEEVAAHAAVVKEAQSKSILPTSDQINSATSSVVPNYQPQNDSERRIANIASFVPYAVGGPETLMANVLKRGVLPGAASTLGGEYFGTPGAIAGALVAPSGRKAAIKQLEDVLPTADELIQAGGAGSQAVRDLQYATKPAANKAWIDAATDDLASRNLLQRSPVVSKLIGDAALQPYMKASDYDLLKLQLGDIKPGSADYTSAQEVLKRLDRHIAGLSPNDALNGDPAEFQKIWGEAKANYAAGKRTQMINDLATAAINKTPGENSGLNLGNNIRKGFGKALNDTRGLSDAEEAALQAANKGTFVENILRSAANRMGGGGGPVGTITALGLKTGMGLGGYEAGKELGFGDVGAVMAYMGAANAMRRAYNSMVRNSARDISLQLAMRSPLAQQRLATAGIPAAMPAKGGDWIRKLLQTRQADLNAK